jgi:hypothetical protein
LNVNDYILRDQDVQELGAILEQWALTIRDLKFLLMNSQHIYGDGQQNESGAMANTESSAANQPILSRNKTLTQ